MLELMVLSTDGEIQMRGDLFVVKIRHKRPVTGLDIQYPGGLKRTDRLPRDIAAHAQGTSQFPLARQARTGLKVIGLNVLLDTVNHL
jgi:hypothetical protein